MLYYITSVTIPAVNAQSVQIMANAESFYKQIPGEFQLITPKVHQITARDETWRKYINCIFKSGRAKYLEFALKVFFMKLEAKSTVYTRDILISLLFAFRGVHVVYEAHQKPSRKIKSIVKYLSKSNSFQLVCISKALQSYYLGEFGLNEKNVLVAHDGVHLEDYTQLASNKSLFHEKLGIPKDKLILLHTGSLYPGRGAELFEVILRQFPDIALVHIGGKESDLSQWREKYKGTPFYCYPHMERSLMIQYQVSADILLYPMLRSTKTYWCCSPMKIFEYMASNRPVVCSAIGSLTEVFTADDGYLFEPDEPITLINAIQSAVTANHNQTKSDNAYFKVKSKYTWSKRVRSILEFIEYKEGISP